MSMIDKVLSRLKSKSGSGAPAAEPSVSVAHAPKNRVKAALIGGIILGLVSAGAWLMWGARHKIMGPASVAQAPAKPISAPQVAPLPIATPVVASGVGVSPVMAASQPVAGATQETLPKEGEPKEHRQEMDTAVLDSSPELALPPSTATRAAKPPAAPGRQKRGKAASTESENIAPEDEPATVPAPKGSVDMVVKPLTLQQQADNEFRRANGLVQQGHINEALTGYETALQLDPAHDAARQAMVVLLLEGKRNADAERVLQEGLKRNIRNSAFAMLLARIQIERDASWSALLTLQKTLPYAERQADYRAFVAALLQRLNRHKEAVAHYQAAVQLSPASGVWWMGLGISLQALQRNEEARAAFQHALDSGTLSADLQTYVSQQMKEL